VSPSPSAVHLDGDLLVAAAADVQLGPSEKVEGLQEIERGLEQHGSAAHDAVEHVLPAARVAVVELAVLTGVERAAVGQGLAIGHAVVDDLGELGDRPDDLLFPTSETRVDGIPETAPCVLHDGREGIALKAKQFRQRQFFHHTLSLSVRFNSNGLG
jgi:hypothetical protein